MATPDALRSYTKDLLRDQTLDDYGYQIDKWKVGLDQVFTSYAMARGHVMTALKKIEEKEAARRALLSAIGMGALSIVLGGVFGFVGTAAAHSMVTSRSRAPAVFDALMRRRIEKQIWVPGRGGADGRWTSVKIRPASDEARIANIYNDAARGVFGGTIAETGKSVVMGGIGEAGSKDGDKPKPHKNGAALSNGTDYTKDLLPFIRETIEIKKFESSVKKAFVDHKTRGEKNVKMIAQGLSEKRNDSWGRSRIEAEEGNYGRAKDAARESVEAVRRKLARDWFFYGHDPDIDVGAMAKAMEKEMWALLILSRPVEVHHVWKKVPVTKKTKIKKLVEAEFAKFDSIVVERLRRLGVVEPVRVTGNAEANRRAHEARKAGRKPPRMIPGIEDDVDTPEEYEKLKRWAENKKASLIDTTTSIEAKFPARKRRLPPILEINK